MKPQAFVLIGSEAAHTRCARSGIAATRLVKLEQSVANLELEVAGLARRVRDLESSSAEQNARNLELTRQVATAAADRAILANQLLAAQDQRREALSECDRLRAKIAELTAPPKVVAVAEPEDATAERFALLELD